MRMYVEKTLAKFYDKKKLKKINGHIKVIINNIDNKI